MAATPATGLLDAAPAQAAPGGTGTAQPDPALGPAAPAKLAGGVDRSHGSSKPQKFVNFLLVLAGTVASGWICLFGGIETIGRWFGHDDWKVVVQARATLMFAANALYMVRLGVTLGFIVKRRVVWGEAVGLGVFQFIIYCAYSLLSCSVVWPATLPGLNELNAADFIGAALVVIGSFLSSYSELQRLWWKAKPENKGHCMTTGLWSLATHINYTGETFLFTGWTMLTSCFYMGVIPILMFWAFVYVHVPPLDEYLADRYGDEFKEWAARTKKLIPYVY